MPRGWTPTNTRTEDLTVTKPNQTVEDVLFTNGANLLLGGDADNLTVRRVKFEGGYIQNNIDLGSAASEAACGTDLLIEDTTFEPAAGKPFTDDFSAVSDGGYTARRIEMVHRGEGFRVGSCGPVTIEDSFVHIVGGITGDCGNPFPDPHSDGIQGFGGRGLSATNNTITFGEMCGTGPYSIGWGSKDPASPPDNVGNYDIDRLLVAGGSYSFQHMTEDAHIRGLRIVNDSWAFGPIYTACSKIDDWEAKLVTLNHSYRDEDGDFRIASEVADLPCDVDAYA